jgi:hypothetical protein
MSGNQRLPRLAIRAYSEAIEPVRQAWRLQLAQLFEDITRSGGTLLPAAPSAPSATEGAATPTKGAPDLLYLVLPATAVQSVFQIIKLWLRERGRAITFEWTEGGETRTWQFTGQVSDQTLREVLKHAVDQDRFS